ncbi:pleckstrin homology domain-containing family G member 5-like isoform X2 [Polypterus senegalus]|nr:pleckstrin homology domain-containing family G member 5-like isoform X2 [Polypterus senegalus]
MFLYWKKRGAYELQPLPTSVSVMESSDMEKYSWSSSLDITDLCDDRGLPEEKDPVCEHPECTERPRAVKVCHHPDCQKLQNQQPLNLCLSCDLRLHQPLEDTMHFDRHLRFDLQPQGSVLARNVSTRSCPPRTCPAPDLEEEDDPERGDRKNSSLKLPKKKPRRRNTDDPSKECFTLKFDLNVDIESEIVPAVKRKTLGEVLAPVFERKGIELSKVDLFLDQSNTPLSHHSEAYRIGGHCLKVKAKPGDEMKVEQAIKDFRSLSLPVMRNAGRLSQFVATPSADKTEEVLGAQDSIDVLAQSRRRKNMMQFLGDANIPTSDSVMQLSASLPTSGISPDTRKNRVASRISGFFTISMNAGSTSKELEQLQSKLHSYSVYGLPKMPTQKPSDQDSWEDDHTSLYLEDSWQRLLAAPELLSQKESHQQEAIWELLDTEASYIRRLEVISDLFLGSLLNLQESGLLCEVEPDRLFSNIQEIIHLHKKLWAEVMVPALERARQQRTPLDITDLQAGFNTFASRFQPYIRYCLEEESCLEYIRSLLQENELFRVYATWAETHKQCDRLKLTDMLVKPHQRLTKYPLLLKSVLKKTGDPATQDAILSMVDSVEMFINQVNLRMRQRQEQQRLDAVTSRIDSHVVVEGSSEEVDKILRDFCHLDLGAPMLHTSPDETRQLLLEGPLRMREGKDSKMDVYCLLFTDLLLITKPAKRTEKAKVVRQPLLVERIVCRELRDPGCFLLVYLNEFHTAVAAFSFQASSQAQCHSWVVALLNTQNLLKKLRNQEAERQGVTEAVDNERPACQHSQLDNSVMLTENPSEESSQSSQGDSGDPPSLSSNREVTSLDSFSASMTPTPELPAESLCMLDNLSESVDSAYGTLSPESLLRRQEPLEMEESETDPGEEQQSSPHYRGSPPMNRSLARCLARPVKCRSEVDISGASKCRLQEMGVPTKAGLAQSRSLSLLCDHSTGSGVKTEVDGGQRDPSTFRRTSLTTDVLRWTHEAGSSCDSRPSEGTSSDEVPQAHSQCAELAEANSATANQPGVGSPAPQHKKLTVAQLYRIRGTLVMNSTLTAS